MSNENDNNSMTLQPLFKGRNFRVNEKLCFVLIPLKEPFLRLFDQQIKPVLETLGFRAVKANDIFRPAQIIEDIWTYLNTARLVVADVTGKNPNVFYELGMAHVIGKDTIILTQNKDDVPFDLRHLRFFDYDDNEAGWKKLRYDLENAVKTAMTDPLHDEVVLEIADFFGEHSFTVERDYSIGPPSEFDVYAYIPGVEGQEYLIDVVSQVGPELERESVSLFHSKLHERADFNELNITPILVTMVPPTSEAQEFAEDNQIQLLHGAPHETIKQLSSLVLRPDYEPI